MSSKKIACAINFTFEKSESGDLEVNLQLEDPEKGKIEYKGTLRPTNEKLNQPDTNPAE